MATKQKHLEFLDALRGLAASYVVVYHLVMLPDTRVIAPAALDRFVHTGGTGVMLFFVVSAFSLYYTMPMRLKEAMPDLSFYLHRFFRIAPLFYVWMFLTIVRDIWYYSAHHRFGEVLASATFTFNLTAAKQQGFVWASWTIGIEMVFYAMFPFIYRRVQDVWRACALMFIFVLVWLAWDVMIPHLYSGPHAALVTSWTFVRFLPVFACGAIAYFLVLPTLNREESPLDRSLGLFLVTLAAVAYISLINGLIPWFFGDQRYWQGLIYMTLLVGLSLNPSIIFVNPVTVYLGRISYSLYLCHTTVILFLTPVYRHFYDITHSNTLGLMISYGVTMLCAVLVSELTYRAIEKPGIKLGKQLHGWLCTSLIGVRKQTVS